MRQKKQLLLSGILFLCLLLVGAAAAGCGRSEAPDPDTAGTTGESGYPIRITDDTGITCEIPEKPTRIVSLSPGNTEILFALGLGDRVVGVTKYCNYPPEAKEKTVIGDLTPEVESVIAVEPDLVVGSASLNYDTLTACRKLNVPVLGLEPKNIEEVYQAIATLARATGTEEQGEKVIAAMKEKFAAVTEKVAAIPEEERLRVFIQAGSDPLITAGNGTFINDLVILAGGRNVAEVDSWVEFSSEKVIELNPDVILARTVIISRMWPM